jgi:hypothetical protein
LNGSLNLKVSKLTEVSEEMIKFVLDLKRYEKINVVIDENTEFEKISLLFDLISKSNKKVTVDVYFKTSSYGHRAQIMGAILNYAQLINSARISDGHVQFEN